MAAATATAGELDAAPPTETMETALPAEVRGWMEREFGPVVLSTSDPDEVVRYLESAEACASST